MKLTFIAEVRIRTVCVDLNSAVKVPDMVSFHSAENCPAQECVVYVHLLLSIHTSWGCGVGATPQALSISQSCSIFRRSSVLIGSGSDVPMKNVDLTKAATHHSV